MSTPTRRPLVLIADDETHILHVLSLKLGRADCDLLTAEDGRQALDLARRHPVDLVITDHQMPLLSGIDLARALAEEPATAHVPVLLLTARGYNIPRQRLEGTRVVAMLSKPFSPTELTDTVRQLLHGSPAAGGASPAEPMLESPAFPAAP